MMDSMQLKTVWVDKSFLTNLIAVLLVIVSYLVPPAQHHLLASIGFFALSGALTNWIAIHMLFEKVPFLYGSGVVQIRFDAFKAGIRHLIMSQFFSAENIEKFFSEQSSTSLEPGRLHQLLDTLDEQAIFDALVAAIMGSSFGGMLNMMGGKEALQPLQVPVTEKLKSALSDHLASEKFASALKTVAGEGVSPEALQEKVGQIVDKRLEELTPKMIKVIVQEMIKAHLGWLVVWGGVFGGLIGFINSILEVAL